MNPIELRRKQVEEILWNQASTPTQCTDALVALLSDAERKGAWAVHNKIKSTAAQFEIEMSGAAEHHQDAIGSARTGYKNCLTAARQVAESFGPDPEGEGK